MFTKQDLKIDSVGDLITFAPIFIFIAFRCTFRYRRIQFRFCNGQGGLVRLVNPDL